MNCKSCDSQINKNAKFCENCGGKVIEKRLTLKAVLGEFFSKFFSWENKLWKTYKFLILNPEDVFETFISGGRKKYFHPFSLLIISGTLMAFTMIFFSNSLKIETAKVLENSYNAGRVSAGADKVSEVPKSIEKFNTFFADFMSKYQDFMYDNMSITILLGIPFYALIAFLVFHKFGKNYAEHLIIQCYQNSLTNIFSTLLIIFGIGAMNYSYLAILGMIIYANYSFGKFYKLNLKQYIIANIKFLLFSIPIYMIFAVFLMAFSFVWLLITNKIEIPTF